MYGDGAVSQGAPGRGSNDEESMMVQRALMMVIVGMAAGVAGCGSGSDGATTATSAAVAPATTATPAAPATTAPRRPSTTVPTPTVPTLQPSSKAQPVSLPAGAVAKVDGQVVTQAQYDQRYAATVRNMRNGPSPIVSDPPRYAKCIAALRALYGKQRTSSNTTAGSSKAPGTAALRIQCRQRHAGLITATMSQLIQGVWTVQRAKAEHVSVSDAEVAKALAQQRKAYPSAAQYSRFLKSNGLTSAALAERIRAGLLSQKLGLKHNGAGTVAKVSDDQINAYFAKNKERFGQPERRDLQLIRTKTQAAAQAAQAAVKHGTSWEDAATKYSIDPAAKVSGGSYPSTVKSGLEPALGAVAFSARVGAVAGPVHGKQGFWIVRVNKIYPGVTPAIGPNRDRIRQLLQSQAQGQVAAKANAAFQASMKAKTLCRAGYVVAMLCANG
jgi:foldase protein PrsA